MKISQLIKLMLFLFPLPLFAASSFYCPQNTGFIKLGMTPAEVVSACGEPIAKQQPNKPVVEKVEVTQLIFNNKGTKTAFYGVWNIRTGSGGSGIEIDIIKNKVASIRIEGSDSNAFSICGGSDIKPGDPAGKVYGACGAPALTNKTFINQLVPGDNKIQEWMYKINQYDPPLRLTFINGKLQSINQ